MLPLNKLSSKTAPPQKSFIEANHFISNILPSQSGITKHSEIRKFQIGDLSRLGENRGSRQKIQTDGIKVKQKNDTFINSRPEQKQQKLTEYLEISGLYKTTAPGNKQIAQYNCDPIHDPTYEKKPLYKYRNNIKSSSTSFITEKYTQDKPWNNTIKADSPWNQNQKASQVDVESYKSSVREVSKFLKEQMSENMFASTVQKRVRTSNEAKKSPKAIVRRRSISEPTNLHLIEQNQFDQNSNRTCLKPNGNFIKTTSERRNLKKEDSRLNEPSSSFLGKAISSVPMKVTTFTSSGYEITQEYVFFDESKFKNSCTEYNSIGSSNPSTVINKENSKKNNTRSRNFDQSYKDVNRNNEKLKVSNSELLSSSNIQELKKIEKNNNVTDNCLMQSEIFKEHNTDDAAINEEESPHLVPISGRLSMSAPPSPTYDNKRRGSYLQKYDKSVSARTSPQDFSSDADNTIGLLTGASDTTLFSKLMENLSEENVANTLQEKEKIRGIATQEITIPIMSFTKASRKPSPTNQFILPSIVVYPDIEKEEVATSSEATSSTLDKLMKNDQQQKSDPSVWKEPNFKNRRCSETIINTYQQPKRELLYGSLNRNLHRRRPVADLHQPNELQRPIARRAAVVSELPDSDLSDLSDTIANLQRNQPIGSSAQLKRSKWAFRKLNFKNKERSRDQKLEDVLLSWKPSPPDESIETILHELKNCKGKHLDHDKSSETIKHKLTNGNRKEAKRHNAVWELFTSERTYLLDHLLVLRQVFMQPLQDLQCEGHLLSVDVRSLFGNMEELCKVSMDFCYALLNVVEDKKSEEFGSADAIDTAFETFGSKMCPPYQRYFSGYRNSLADREELKSNEEYIVFLKWCERNPRCQRLKLSDLLVSPMQHLTKFPLLLRNIAKYTDDQHQCSSIKKTLLEVQESLKTLEGKVSWLNHFQFLQDLQSSITWPPVYEIDNKTILPDSLRLALTTQPCKNLIANPQRQLIMEGALCVVENGKAIDVYAFLFDDMLLLTKQKKGKRKPSEIPSSLKQHAFLKDGTLLSVYRQPVALDRFMVYDVDGEQASSLGLKKAFLLVQENRFQQMCSIVMLQAATEDIKRSWLTYIASTAAQWMEKNIYSSKTHSSSKMKKEHSSDNNELNGKGRHEAKLQKTRSGRINLVDSLPSVYASIDIEDKDDERATLQPVQNSDPEDGSCTESDYL